MSSRGAVDFATRSNRNQKNKLKQYTLLYQNVRGLRSKLDCCKNAILAESADLLAFTETFLVSSVNDAEIFPSDYSVIRRDRLGDVGWGGVLLAIKKTNKFKQIVDIDGYCNDIELVIAIVTFKYTKIVVCVVYIPPNSGEMKYINTFTVIENLVYKYPKLGILIIGDFNLNSCNQNVLLQFNYMITYCKLKQYNTIKNKYGEMLDLVLSNLDDSCVEVSGDVLPVVPADAYHPPLSVSVASVHRAAGQSVARATAPEPCQHQMTREWNFRKADYHSLYLSLSTVQWDEIYACKDVDIAVNIFYDLIGKCFDRYVPYKKSYNSNPRYQYPTWYTSDIILNIKNKYFHLKKFKETQLEFNKEMFKYYRQRVKVLIDLAFSNYIKSTEYSIKINPKHFWKFIQEQKSARQSNVEFEYNGKVVSGIDAANAFADYFKSVFLNDTQLSPGPVDSVMTAGTLCSSRIAVDSISSHDLSLAIRRLRAQSSAGPDGIPPYILKDCFHVFELPLLHIYNLILSTETYPSRWKISRVTPIPKSGSSPVVENHRPIAVLSAFSKLLESVLNHQITAQIRTQLSDAQHGFRANRSTVTNHINFVDYAVTEMDHKKQVDAAYFDFKKAFDRVSNDVLLSKFSNIGFTPKLLNLFTNYFTARMQYVQILGYRSDLYLTCSGVSQGSTLGPTQFLIMINDLPDVVESSQCLMFADDLKLFLGVDSIADCEALQRDIDNVVKWSAQNRLEFNTNKCKTITFTRSYSPIAYPYSVEGVPLERVTQIRDLGLVLDTELTFNAHISELCDRAFKSLGFVMRQTVRFNEKNTIVTLYNAFVRSKLEYNAVIWNPHESKYKLMVEKVQKNFVVICTKNYMVITLISFHHCS